MRVAVISDIHGNRPALEAVLADIRTQGVDLTVNLGDVLSGPIDPAGTLAILRDLDLPTVSGNHERGVLDKKTKDHVDAWAHTQIGKADLNWIKSLPGTLSLERELFLCHGTPSSDELPWLDSWFNGRSNSLPDEASVTAYADGIDFPVLLCGHTHVARAVRLADGRMVVNPGSVGLQFFYGAPDARYALLEQRKNAWAVAFKLVPYDATTAGKLAVANGFPAWQRALTTGWAGPEGLFGSIRES